MLSIIIITKNEERCIPRLLKSIKAQSFKDYEIIVSDADSNDNTRKIAKEFGCKIVDGGLPSVGRNNGAKIAEGDILLFLDADGMLPKDFLPKALTEFNKRKLGCATTFFIPISHNFLDRSLFLLYNLWALFMQYISPHAGGFCIIVKKDLFEKVGGFNEKILIAEDHNFAKKCSKKAKFRLLKSTIVFGDMRRFRREGRFKVFIKLFYLGFIRLFLGDRKKPIINYNLHGGVEIKRATLIKSKNFSI